MREQDTETQEDKSFSIQPHKGLNEMVTSRTEVAQDMKKDGCSQAKIPQPDPANLSWKTLLEPLKEPTKCCQNQSLQIPNRRHITSEKTLHNSFPCSAKIRMQFAKRENIQAEDDHFELQCFFEDAMNVVFERTAENAYTSSGTPSLSSASMGCILGKGWAIKEPFWLCLSAASREEIAGGQSRGNLGPNTS